MSSILYTHTLFPVSYSHSLTVSTVDIVIVTIDVGLTALIVGIITVTMDVEKVHPVLVLSDSQHEIRSTIGRELFCSGKRVSLQGTQPVEMAVCLGLFCALFLRCICLVAALPIINYQRSASPEVKTG